MRDRVAEHKTAAPRRLGVRQGALEEDTRHRRADVSSRNILGLLAVETRQTNRAAQHTLSIACGHHSVLTRIAAAQRTILD